MGNSTDKLEEFGQSSSEIQSGHEKLRTGNEQLWEDVMGVLNQLADTLRGEIQSAKDSLFTVVAMEEEIKEMKSDLALCKMAVAQ